MKKSLLLLMVLLFSMNLFASTYSTSSENNPFGICAIWGNDSIYINHALGFHHFCYCDEQILPLLREYYLEFKLHEAKSGGISWIRANGLPKWIMLQDSYGQFEMDKLEQLDSFVLFINEQGLYAQYFGLPYRGEIDDGLPLDSQWYYFWNALVERYDGDGEGFNTPWNQSIPEAILPNGTPLIIKYWEISNEPDRFPEWYPPCPVDSNSGKTLQNYLNYARISSQAIHFADSEAMVIGPSFAHTYTNYWVRYHGRWTNNDTLNEIIDSVEPESIWSIVFNEPGVFDIISTHEYHPVNHVSWAIDKLEDWIDTSVYYKDSPVWMTEIGWGIDEGYSLEEIAINYDTFLDYVIEKNFPDKFFFYCLGDIYYNTSLSEWMNWQHNLFDVLYSDNYPFPAFDTLKRFIYKNIPYIHLIDSCNNNIYYSKQIYNIEFDSIFDQHNYNKSNEIFVKMEYSTNGGWSWVCIDSLNELIYYGYTELLCGSYCWNIPEISSENCKIRVIAKDSDNLEGVSTSDNIFSIRTCYWPIDVEIYSKRWDCSWDFGICDESDYIIETSDTNYLVSVKIQDDTTGLVLFEPATQEYIKVKTYHNSKFSWIRCIIERNQFNQYLLAGSFKNSHNIDKGIIQLVDSNYNTLAFTKFDVGENSGTIMRIIEDVSNNGYIFIGWKNQKLYTGRFTISNKDMIIFDSTFADSFNNLNIPGHLYSIVKTSDDYYICVGSLFDTPYDKGCYYVLDIDGNIIAFGEMSNPTGSLKAMDVIGVSSTDFYIVGNHSSDGVFINNVNLIEAQNSWERFYNKNNYPFINNFNSVFINYSDYIIVGGSGIDPLINQEVGLIFVINSQNGNIVDDYIFAPLSGLYQNYRDKSSIRHIYQTSDSGFVVAGRLYYTQGAWNRDAGICKYSYNPQFNPYNQYPGSILFDLNDYSIMCANSLFRDKSTIRFVLPRQCNVNIVVYNILGQRVRTLVNEEREPGAYEIFWDGTDSRGVSVSSGSYFLRFQAGDFLSTKSLTVIR